MWMRRVVLVLATIAACALAAGFTVAADGQDADATEVPPEPAAATPPGSAPSDPTPLVEAFDVRRGREDGFPILRVRPRQRVALHSRPGGRVLLRVRSRTEFGSRRTLSIVERRGEWLGVVDTNLKNNRVGWVRDDPKRLRTRRTMRSLEVDLSERRVQVLEGERVIGSPEIGIGGGNSPTPAGRFAVTDLLPGREVGPAYGCCAIAMSGHQENLPKGWIGGDRIALHGTRDPSTIGHRVSNGCLRAGADDLRALMAIIPLGAPVFVRA